MEEELPRCWKMWLKTWKLKSRDSKQISWFFAKAIQELRPKNFKVSKYENYGSFIIKRVFRFIFAFLKFETRRVISYNRYGRSLIKRCNFINVLVFYARTLIVQESLKIDVWIQPDNSAINQSIFTKAFFGCKIKCQKRLMGAWKPFSSIID